MKRYLAPLLVAPLLLAGVPASATTATPCVRHDAVAPYVSLVSGGVSYLAGPGGIGGCPKPGSVAGTVALQHFEAGLWVTKGQASYAGSWGALYRYARQASNIATAVCSPGQWRTHVTGGDGFTPAAWDSPVVTFAPGEGEQAGGCFYGGGD